MSTEWTVERLEGLPEGTVIEWIVPGGQPLRYFIKDLGVSDPDRPWRYTKGGAESSLDLLRMVALKESLRVVSVPIDALLADDAADAVCDVLDEDGHNGYDCRPERSIDVTAKRAIRAAVAHVTGEATT